MFSIGPQEIVIIMIVALVIVGPEKLPDLARMVGRAMRDLRKYANDVRNEFEKDLPIDEIKRDLDVFSQETPSHDYSYGDSSDTSEDDSYACEDEASLEEREDESGEGAEQDEAREEDVNGSSDTEGRLEGDYPPN